MLAVFPAVSVFRPAVVLLALVIVPGAAAPARAAGPSLPRELGAAEQARLAPITSAATLTTRWEGEGFATRLAVFEYLLDHPELTSHVGRALKVARYRIWRTRDGLWLDDGWGAKGRLEVVHASKGVRVLLARGEFEQRVLPNIAGEAVIVVEYATAPAPGGETPHRITPTISGFVKLDSRLLAAASRLASTAAKEKADKEAQRLAKVLLRIARAIEENPARVYELVRQRPDVPARELDGFRQLLNLPKTAMP
jgi:hypothetical protein